ncbi:MAG: hypothetical protein KKH98_11175, partial [Spirochaetes bacterium]|nr:hypothetical protein [Spirochaetota bacterium]
MKMKNNKYDLILVNTFFRIHNYYLNIIKELFNKIKIGLFVLHPEKNKTYLDKVIDTEESFIQECVHFGAHLIKEKEKCSCRLLLVPQNITSIGQLKNIKSEKVIGLHRYGWASLGLDLLKKLGMKRFWAYQKNIFFDMLKFENGEDKIRNLQIIEMGIPYKKYPAYDFKGLDMDYLIAYPSPMFLRDPSVQVKLLENIIKIIKKIPKGNRIFLKLHNVRDEGHKISGRRLFNNLNIFFISLMSFFVKGIRLFLPWYSRLARLQIMFLSLYLEKKVILLSDVTDLYNFGIEHYLPFVKKGIITGISSCAWYALYNDLPVYNCDDQPLLEETPNYAVIRNFYLSPCYGELKFNRADFKRISDSSRK